MTKLTTCQHQEKCVNAVLWMQLASKLRLCSSMATHIMSHLSNLHKTAWNCFAITLWAISAVVAVADVQLPESTEA